MPTKTKSAAATVEEPQYEAPEETLEETLEDLAEEQWEDPDAADAPEVADATRLTGSELADFFREQKAAGVPLTEIARQAGYVAVTKAGTERLMMAAFNNALLVALDVVDPGQTSVGRGPGRASTAMERARVSGNMSLLVGRAAVTAAGGVQGSIFSVSFPEPNSILLTLTDEIKPVVPRKQGKAETAEQPGTPLLDQAA
jgi:hypothetical protein